MKRTLDNIRVGSKAGALVCLVFLLLTTAFAQRSATPSAGTASSEQHQAGNDSTGHQAAGTEAKESGEDENAQFKHSPSVQFVAKLTGLSLEHAYWLSVLLNFAVIAGLILWISKKKLPGVFRGRTASIQKAMEEARAASEEANRRLAEIEARLSRLSVEIGDLRASAEKETAAEEARIQAAAAEDARKIVESAEQEIAAAAKSARRELTTYAADLAVSLATKQIQVNSATDQALVRNFSQQLSVDGGQPGKERR
jgi:F-type H+-transporting ATPase subunit b